jgi:hypothetical protein
MILIFNDTGKQISPCIASMAKRALGLKSEIPNNIKKCTPRYWSLTIETIGKQAGLADSIIETAKTKFDTYIK